MWLPLAATALALFQSGFANQNLAHRSPRIRADDISWENVASRQLNFGLAVHEPMVFSPDHSVLYALNQPGARLALLDPVTLALEGQIPLGLGAVSIALRPGTSEIWVVDALASCVNIVDPDLGAIVRTIRVGGDPRGIVFTPDGDRAYVTCSAFDQVDVIDGATYAVAKSIAIPARNPRGIAYFAGKAYVVPLLSGNGTAPRGSLADPYAIETVGVPGPPEANPLPDRDLFVITTEADPAQDSLDPAATVSGLGTILFNIHVRPGSSELWIPNTDALNATFKGEVNFPGGQVVRNRITIVDATGGSQREVIDLDAIAPPGRKCAQPTYVSFDPVQPLAYVAGYGSDAVVVLRLHPGGAVTWEGAIDLPPSRVYPRGTGPRSCFVDPARTAVYAYDFNDDAVSRIAVASLPGGTGWTATAPDAVRTGLDRTSGFERLGRHLFTNARFSASQTSSCASCHVDGHTDGLAWDLSHFLDPEGTPAGSLQFGTDVKGPVITQSVRSLEEKGPFHWRGERSSTNQFAQTFVTLLENTVDGNVQTIGPDFQYVRHFMDLLAIPPNPRERFDRRLTSEELEGSALFQSRPVQGSATCASCHALPLGTTNEIVAESDGGIVRALVVPSLRSVADKLTPPIDLGGAFGVRNELGAGLTHAGSRARLEDAFAHPAPAGSGHHSFDLSAEEAQKIAAFLEVFDTGLAPSTGFMVTANAENWASVASQDLPRLKQAARRGDCDLIFQRVPRPYLGHLAELSGMYDPSLYNAYRGASKAAAPITETALLAEAANGLPVVFLGVPIGMGESHGLDRDVDGLYDLDEIARGTDPENPNTDGDAFADGHEVDNSMDPLHFDTVSPDTVPPATVGPARLLLATATTLQIEIETTEFCKAFVGYNGNSGVLRLPLNPFGDHHHWIRLNELEPDTQYTIDLRLVDAAENTTLDSTNVFRTKPRATPDPARVGALDLSIDASGSQPELRADITIRVGSATAGADYVVSVAAYFSAPDGSLVLLSSGTSAATDPDGLAAFSIPLPEADLVPGTLFVVVEDVAAPGGGAPWARGLDTPNLATIAY